MTSNAFAYNPDPNALIQPPWNYTLLAQRDVNSQIPLNYGTVPGVSVTAACFTNQTYEDYATVRCISNLLATGFRRLSFDLYWDVGRTSWTFCPVSLPLSSDVGSGRTVFAGESQVATADTISTTPGPDFSDISITQVTDTSFPQKRTLQRRQFQLSTLQGAQQVTTTTITQTTLSISLETTGTLPAAVIPTQIPADTDEVIWSIGPYRCSGSTATDILTELLTSYLVATDTTTAAETLYITFDLHAAAPLADPLAPAQAPTPEQLPSPDDLLGQYFASNASSFLYTPSLLAQARSDLNQSWLGTQESVFNPSSEYFDVANVDGILKSNDGWPSLSYSEFKLNEHRRIFFEYGRVDPQMSGYNFAGDAMTMFPANYLSSLTQVSISSNGQVSDGCIYNPGNTSLSAANNSWAIYAGSTASSIAGEIAAMPGLNATLPEIGNLTFCGISPFLNTSLLNASANTNIVPYKYYAYSSIWSWAWGQPLVNNTDLRCAIMDPLIPGGRWRSVDCDSDHYGACRNDYEPNVWAITSDHDDYNSVGRSCPPNTTFAVPRTALENRYLYEAYQANTTIENRAEPLWINLNCKDVPSCWVVGNNATCPYGMPEDNSAQVYAPTVAGLIILIITGILILLKCGSNRARSKRKRRGDNGWDYEGVPS